MWNLFSFEPKRMLNIWRWFLNIPHCDCIIFTQCYQQSLKSALNAFWLRFKIWRGLQTHAILTPVIFNFWPGFHSLILPTVPHWHETWTRCRIFVRISWFRSQVCPRMSTHSNAHAKIKKCIFEVHYPGNRFELGLIVNDFWSSTIWAVQI